MRRFRPCAPAGTDKPVMTKVSLGVNGQRRDMGHDTHTSPLDAAREHLKGPKRSAILLDGQPVADVLRG